MDIKEYFEMIVLPILIGLTMITLFLLFLYMVYGKEEQGNSLPRRFSGLCERLIVFNQSLISILLMIS